MGGRWPLAPAGEGVAAVPDGGEGERANRGREKVFLGRGQVDRGTVQAWEGAEMASKAVATSYPTPESPTGAIHISINY